MQITLEDYLKKNIENQVIDHIIRAHHWQGKTTIYIHAQDKNSDTLDFEVRGNELIDLKATIGPARQE